MAFASLDFLAVVKPSFCSAYLRGLDRLTIQTSRRGMFVPLLFFSDARTECIVDSDPHPLELPGSQVMVDTLPLGEIGGQHTPLDPTFGDIKDGIEYGPHTQGTRSSTAFGGWDHIFDPLPFLVGQVAWIYFFAHIPILHNPRRLFRQALRVIRVANRFQKGVLSQSSIFGQNPKIWCQEFNDLQTPKLSKKQLCDRTRQIHHALGG